MLKLNDPQGYKGIACANESLLGNNRKNERTNERAVVKIKCICLEQLERNKISHTTPHLVYPFLIVPSLHLLHVTHTFKDIEIKILKDICLGVCKFLYLFVYVCVREYVSE